MKKTLLIAAAALVAGVVSSQAQVYSANIVGYVNQVLPKALALVSNPLDNGTNTANTLLGALPAKSTLQIWNGAGFSLYTQTANGWTNTSTLQGNPSLPVGTGYFVSSSSPYTNTYVGNVVPAPGGNIATNALPKALALVGSILPVSGFVDDTGTNTLNLGALPAKSTMQLWNGAGFTLFTKSGSIWTNTTLLTGNPAYTVGQGVFISSSSATNWTQTLQ
jgi:hypothetical protein